MKTIEIPICLGFDKKQIVGWVEIDDKLKDVFPEMALSPEFILGKKNEIIGFGLVEFESYKKATERFFNQAKNINSKS